MYKETELNQGKEIAIIRLKGAPYQQEMNGIMVDCTETLEALAINSGYEFSLDTNIQKNQENLKPLFDGGYYGIDAKIKKGEALTYSEAFSLMSFVSMGVNKLVHDKLTPNVKVGSMDPDTVFLQSIALLSAMSAKESFVGLTSTEIAGLTASALEIDTIIRIPAPSSVLGIGGMGGDRGYKRNGNNSKLFSLSTMGAVVLANFGYVHKHHSYPNTSKVAGQSAIEAFGAMSNQSSPSEFAALQTDTGLLMSSCHTTRLIHTLSHRLKGETINHIIGPLAIPVDRDTPVNAFIGANDNVHPETITKALVIMQEHGVQKYSNSVAFCGLNSQDVPDSLFNPDEYYKDKEAKSKVAIDEVAPPPFNTLAAFLINGVNMGTFLIEPLDFMDENSLQNIDLKNLLIPNTEEAIMDANINALTGTDKSKAHYLAMTAALGLFTKEYANLPQGFDERSRRINKSYLQDAFKRSYEVITSGVAYNKLQGYVTATGGQFKDK